MTLDRLAFALAAAAAAVVLAVVFLWPAGTSGPAIIHYGSDTCARCRMILSRPGFAGEVRDRTGAIAKYDDIGCMLEGMLAERGEMPAAWVEDHPSGRLVPLLTATLVRSASIETPMGHGIVAFADPDAARGFALAKGGEVVAFEDLVGQRTRHARRSPATGQEKVP